MKSYDLITPEGTRDLLFEECKVRKETEDILRDIFTSHGYSEVITPALEFYDVFNNKTRTYSQEKMYKLTDGKGRLLVLRPDSTMPVVRIAATRLKDSAFPLKLFCAQNIYRCNPKMAGRDDEIMQSGIEIIGGEQKRSDIEALSLAAQVLNCCSSGDVRLEIGDIAFYDLIIRQLNISEDEEITVRSLVSSKNTHELTRHLDRILGAERENSKYAEMLLRLPTLFGGAEVFPKAQKLFQGTELEQRLSELKETFDTLCTLQADDRITVDLGLVSMWEYYTGIVFRGYIEEYGQSVISGGRYDTLVGNFTKEDMPAIGFAANVTAIVDAKLRKNAYKKISRADILVYADDNSLIKGMKYCSELISKGYKTEFSSCSAQEEAADYAKAAGIKELHIISSENEETLKIML